MGLPSEEGDLFERLAQNGIISAVMKETLRSMKGFRNILAHDYTGIDNTIAYEIATTRLTDFELFIKEILCVTARRQ